MDELSTEATSRKDRSAGGRETLIVCEDDDRVRNLICQILSAAGYKLLTATNGRHALEIINEHGDQVGDDHSLGKLLQGKERFSRVLRK